MFAGPNVGCKTKVFFIDVFSVTLAPALTYGELGVKILSCMMLFYLQISEITAVSVFTQFITRIDTADR